MKLKERLSRYWTYFRRGHSIYLAFLISFANFVAIQYNLVIKNVAFLKDLFTHLTYFAAIFALLYIPIAVVIGWYDYRKFAVPTESALRSMASPWTRDLARALILIAEGKNEEAIKVLEKWVRGFQKAKS